MALISPRNAPNAVVLLLQKTGAKDLFIAPDPATRDLAETAIRQIGGDSQESPIQLYPMPAFEELFPTHPDTPFESFPPRTYNVDSSGLILHSSGLLSFFRSMIHDFCLHSIFQGPLLSLSQSYAHIDS